MPACLPVPSRSCLPQASAPSAISWPAAPLAGRAPGPWRHLPWLALSVGTGQAAAILVLPSSLLLQTLHEVMLPSVLLNALATLAGGLMLTHDCRRRDLVRANALYRAAIEALPDSLNVEDQAGRFLVANPATARQMRAGSAEALIGHSDHEFSPVPLADTYRLAEEAIIAAGEPALLEQPIAFDDGAEGWLATLKTPLRDPRHHRHRVSARPPVPQP